MIISRDGLILSQQHVSHVSRQTGKKDTPRHAGEQIEIAMQDGRRLKAELLGSDRVRDLSLLKIVDPGVYPHLEMAQPGSVTVGDRVIKLGTRPGIEPIAARLPGSGACSTPASRSRSWPTP